MSINSSANLIIIVAFTGNIPRPIQKIGSGHQHMYCVVMITLRMSPKEGYIIGPIGALTSPIVTIKVQLLGPTFH